jgi:autotransporter-associated beta strand protein
MKSRHIIFSATFRRLARAVAFRTLFAACAVGFGSHALADTYTWTGADPDHVNYFGAVGNWSPGVVPGAEDTVSFTAPDGTKANEIDLRNLDNSNPGSWTVENWFYNSSVTLSILGRSTGDVALTITDTLTKQGSGNLAFRNQSTEVRRLDLTIGTINMESGTLSFGTTSDGISVLNVGTANISGGVMNLRPVSGTTANIANINFTGDGILDLHGTSTGENSILATTSLTSVGSTGTIQTTDGNTAVLRITNAAGSTANYGGTITSAGTSLEKFGTGTQVLSGANTYGGGTKLSEGTLLINNTTGSGTGTGAVLVQSSGVLGGTGFIGGAVTTESNGHIAPGDGGAGILTIQNTLTLANGTHLDYQLNAANVAGGTVGNDLLSVIGTAGNNGDLTLGSDIVLDLTGLGTSFGPGKYDLIDFTGTLTGADNLASWTATGLSEPYSFGVDGNSVYLNVASVPEPNTVALLIFGAGVLVYFVRRRNPVSCVAAE